MAGEVRAVAIVSEVKPGLVFDGEALVGLFDELPQFVPPTAGLRRWRAGPSFGRWALTDRASNRGSVPFAQQALSGEDIGPAGLARRLLLLIGA
jgi:hypothetical protein